MRRALKMAGTGLLFLLATLAFAAALLPKLLDQRYYDGPVSDHYDGERFFNPGEANRPARSPAMMARFFSGSGRAEWPERVPVTQRRPPLIDPVDEDRRRMVATWIGHATVLIQAGGINILTDPIFSERASPFSRIGPKRARAPGIRLEDLPEIAVIVISHNHYDHMDLPSLKALWKRDKPVIVTSLGNETLLRNAGIPARMPCEWPGGRCPGVEALDWGERTSLGTPSTSPNFFALVEVGRNHHWSSRRVGDRNRALWSAFTITTPAGTIYYAGDTGFGDGRWVAEAAQRLTKRFGERVRLAILPIGAYEPREAMKGHHINPAESLRIFDQLRPAMALGVHWGTFQLTFEAIDAPPRELARVRGGRNFVTSEVGVSLVVPEVVSGAPTR